MPKHIMVINDTQEILELFYDLLTPEGYNVSLHSYSTRELDEVKRVRPDLIVSDHPPFHELKGWQFVQKLKMDRETANIPVIICTTSIKWVRENADEGWLAAKGVGVIPKPFNVDELLNEIRAYIGEADAPGLGPMAEGASGLQKARKQRAPDEA